MLTRNEYVNICSSCINRKFDPQQGVVCGLTSQKADFDEECPSYELDEKTQTSFHTSSYNTDLEIEEESKNKAEKDILYGALWLIGGAVLTFAEIGYIFWGAIVFGGIQLIQGLIALPTKKS